MVMLVEVLVVALSILPLAEVCLGDVADAATGFCGLTLPVSNFGLLFETGCFESELVFSGGGLSDILILNAIPVVFCQNCKTT